jgi:hypothetical protein
VFEGISRKKGDEISRKNRYNVVDMAVKSEAKLAVILYF